eukprot:1844373-Rhodomonas_salina.1
MSVPSQHVSGTEMVSLAGWDLCGEGERPSCRDDAAVPVRDSRERSPDLGRTHRRLRRGRLPGTGQTAVRDRHFHAGR